jgi:hypothetical protein
MCCAQTTDVQPRQDVAGNLALCDACLATTLEWDLLRHQVQCAVLEREALAMQSAKPRHPWWKLEWQSKTT